VRRRGASRAHEALDAGINHFDVAAGYGDAELRLAPWLTHHRDSVFLATKTGERDRAAAREEIHRSLDRLGVDHVDLLQLHNLVDVIEWETALRDGGALEAGLTVLLLPPVQRGAERGLDLVVRLF